MGQSEDFGGIVVGITPTVPAGYHQKGETAIPKRVAPLSRRYRRRSGEEGD